MSNGNGETNGPMFGWPVWAKLVAFLGFPIVLNLLLIAAGWRVIMYVIDTQVVHYVAENNSILRKHVSDLEGLSADIAEVKQILWAICINDADSETRKTRCMTSIFSEKRKNQ